MTPIFRVVAAPLASEAQPCVLTKRNRLGRYERVAGRLLRFLQHVGDNGYDWVFTKPLSAEPEAFVLTDNVPVGREYTGRVYNALAKPRLFREFAELAKHLADAKAFREQAREFANRYGLLGVEGVPINLGGLPGVGELLREWTDAVREVYLAVELWDNLQANDKDALRQRIQWTESGVLYESQSLRVKYEGKELPALRKLISSPLDSPAKWETLHPGGVVLPARWLLQEWVNKALARGINGTLLWTGRAGQGQFELHYQPANLLSAMWCQLAREIAKNESERVCEYCGKALANDARKDKRFCNNKCRAYHSRKQRRSNRAECE